MKLTFSLDGLSEEQVAVYQTAVMDTLDQLQIPYEHDEWLAHSKLYCVTIRAEIIRVGGM